MNRKKLIRDLLFIRRILFGLVIFSLLFFLYFREFVSPLIFLCKALCFLSR
uniref:Uncharacterized protein n=1 Tax=Meloidogyne enterolobii TaxID=390850 RepID=A0A6V7W1T2_MELEN|nr:unnamed protein product [Meloidogyne enterolobii]